VSRIPFPLFDANRQSPSCLASTLPSFSLHEHSTVRWSKPRAQPPILPLLIFFCSTTSIRDSSLFQLQQHPASLSSYRITRRSDFMAGTLLPFPFGSVGRDGYLPFPRCSPPLSRPTREEVKVGLRHASVSMGTALMYPFGHCAALHQFSKGRVSRS